MHIIWRLSFRQSSENVLLVPQDHLTARIHSYGRVSILAKSLAFPRIRRGIRSNLAKAEESHRLARAPVARITSLQQLRSAQVSLNNMQWPNDLIYSDI